MEFERVGSAGEKKTLKRQFGSLCLRSESASVPDIICQAGTKSHPKLCDMALTLQRTTRFVRGILRRFDDIFIKGCCSCQKCTP